MLRVAQEQAPGADDVGTAAAGDSGPARVVRSPRQDRATWFPSVRSGDTLAWAVPGTDESIREEHWPVCALALAG